ISCLPVSATRPWEPCGIAAKFLAENAARVPDLNQKTITLLNGREPSTIERRKLVQQCVRIREPAPRDRSPEGADLRMAPFEHREAAPRRNVVVSTTFPWSRATNRKATSPEGSGADAHAALLLRVNEATPGVLGRVTARSCRSTPTSVWIGCNRCAT